MINAAAKTAATMIRLSSAFLLRLLKRAEKGLTGFDGAVGSPSAELAS